MATIHIESHKYYSDKGNVKVQNIPFKIEADCEAKVDDFFNCCVKNSNNNTKQASFRGYPLNGKTVNLPGGYVGLVLHESIKPSNDKEERKFHIINNFDEIIFWNWDKQTSEDDSITQAMQWLEIAEVLHSPIVEE